MPSSSARCLSVLDWKRDRSQSAFVCLESSNRRGVRRSRPARQRRRALTFFGPTPPEEWGPPRERAQHVVLSTAGAAGTAKSASELGGMDKLVEAAKKEGKLNVIALPPDWANYGEMLETFSKKYDIEINSASPKSRSGSCLFYSKNCPTLARR